MFSMYLFRVSHEIGNIYNLIFWQIKVNTVGCCTCALLGSCNFMGDATPDSFAKPRISTHTRKYPWRVLSALRMPNTNLLRWCTFWSMLQYCIHAFEKIGGEQYRNSSVQLSFVDDNSTLVRRFCTVWESVIPLLTDTAVSSNRGFWKSSVFSLFSTSSFLMLSVILKSCNLY